MYDVFRSLKISNKIASIFFIFLLMMGIGGGIGLYNAISITRVAKLFYSESFKKAETLSAMEKELLSGHQELFLHTIVSDEGSKSFLFASIEDRKQAIKGFAEDFRRSAIDAKSGVMLDGFLKDTEAYWDVGNTVLNLSAAGREAQARKLAGEEGKASFTKALLSLKEISEIEKNAAYLVYQKSEYLGRIIVIITITATIVALIMATGLWLMLSRSIVNPIVAIEESAKKLSRGDLRQRARVESSDEIGALATAFNKMAENLEGYYETLEKKVEDRTEELRFANEDLYRKKKELENKNEELGMATRMKTQFLANVSHELRTPLNSIIGFSELLQEKSFGDLNEKQGQYVKFISTSGTHLLQLINSILDMSKIEAGRMELIEERFPLSDVLNETLGIVTPIAHKKNVTIETKDVPASPVITADKGKFKQIMFNLLSNAVKFNVEGGRVIIDWDIKEEPLGMSVQKILEISVEDTGCGIKDVDIKRLFREFEQLDPTITREYGGTGLGLALTKKLVELHKGEITVWSEYGRGCRFTVTIPQGGEKPDVVAVHVRPKYEAALEPVEDRPVVIVASESEEINHLLGIYLSGENYTCVFVSDGVELIEKVRDIGPFAIVMGIMLPKKDGWEVLKELKADARTRDIPSIIISSSNHKDLGFALGAVDYLVKPIDRARLLETLGRLSLPKKSRIRTVRVLAVDDEPAVLSLLGDMLEKEGLSVLKAEDGETAVKTAMELMPDLIILDLMMPGMSGFEVVEKLREHPVVRDIPIVIFTAKDITQKDRERLGTSIKKVIQKAGFSKEDFLSELRHLELAYPEKANLIDRKTGLFNGRYFDIVFSRELSRCERYGYNLSVLFLDIDDFSHYNQTNGAGMGDRALKELAALFAENLRKADCVTRYGSDEFAVLLPGIAGEDAFKVAEKLRMSVARHRFHTIGGADGLTVSIGVATVAGGYTNIKIIEDIQSAIKKAQAAGGNSVVVSKASGDGKG